MRSQTLCRAVAAVVAVPALVFSMAACGGDGGGDKGEQKGGGTSEQSGGGSADGGEGGSGDGGSKGASKPLTKAQLSTALLKTGDVPGYKVHRSTKPLIADNLPTGQPQCKPVLDEFSPDSTKKRTAYVGAEVNRGEMSTQQTLSQVLLSSYEPDDAERVLSDLKSGLKSCKEISGPGQGGKSSKVTVQEAQAPDLGDDSVRYLLKGISAKNVTLSMTVVRSGATTTHFTSMSLGGQEVHVPDTVAKKQVAKVEAAHS